MNSCTFTNWVIVLVIVIIFIYALNQNLFQDLFKNFSCDYQLSPLGALDTTPFFDEILYQNPPAVNRRGYDLPVGHGFPGPVWYFHQKFNNDAAQLLGWRKYYLDKYNP
jgi:hypothetical protein